MRIKHMHGEMLPSPLCFMLAIIATFFFIVIFIKQNNQFFLRSVDDNEIRNYIKIQPCVIVLFTTYHCNECEKYEDELIFFRDHLADSLNARIFKAIDSPKLKLYSLNNAEFALVFFRNGQPLLYSGPPKVEGILKFLLANKLPIVEELTDINFEHLTQASSGATTGDWFVMFYSTDCVECQQLEARWEAVGAEIKQSVNVARVNAYPTYDLFWLWQWMLQASTAKRFNVSDVPEFILFRQGKMYRYQDRMKYDLDDFVGFAKDGWKNADEEEIPKPRSSFEDLPLTCVNFLKEERLGMTVIIAVCAWMIFCELRRP